MWDSIKPNETNSSPPTFSIPLEWKRNETREIGGCLVCLVIRLAEAERKKD